MISKCPRNLIPMKSRKSISREETFTGKSTFPGSQISREVNFPGKSTFPGSHFFREIKFPWYSRWKQWMKMRQMMKRKDTYIHTYEHGKKAPVDLTAPLQVKTIPLVTNLLASGKSKERWISRTQMSPSHSSKDEAWNGYVLLFWNGIRHAHRSSVTNRYFLIASNFPEVCELRKG